MLGQKSSVLLLAIQGDAQLFHGDRLGFKETGG
jgi:hypothetical protein